MCRLRGLQDFQISKEKDLENKNMQVGTTRRDELHGAKVYATRLRET
jgi:hypothetical protein